MLDAPRFDTYGILKKVAADPSSKERRLQLMLLKRRTSRERLWETFGMAKPGMDFGELLELRTGKAVAANTPRKISFMDNIDNLSLAERDDFYIEMCKRAGIPMSQEMLDKARKHE